MNTLPLVGLALICFVAACDQRESASSATVPPAPPLPERSVAAQAGTATTARAKFEGEVGLLATSAKAQKPLALALLIKGAKLRLDLPESLAASHQLGKLRIVMNAPEKQLFAVLDDKRQVVSVNLETAGEQLQALRPKGAAPGAQNQAQPTLRKTGQRDRVAGRDCEEWEILHPDGSKVSVCVASEGTAWLSLPAIGLPAEQAWASALIDGKHLPLRAISIEANGKEGGRLEVTRLDPKTVPDSSFELPKGYQTLDLMSAMRSVMAGALGAAAPPTRDAKGKPRKLPPDIQAMIQKMQQRAQEPSAANGQ